MKNHPKKNFQMQSSNFNQDWLQLKFSKHNATLSLYQKDGERELDVTLVNDEGEAINIRLQQGDVAALRNFLNQNLMQGITQAIAEEFKCKSSQ